MYFIGILSTIKQLQSTIVKKLSEESRENCSDIVLAEQAVSICFKKRYWC